MVAVRATWLTPTIPNIANKTVSKEAIIKVVSILDLKVFMAMYNTVLIKPE